MISGCRVKRWSGASGHTSEDFTKPDEEDISFHRYYNLILKDDEVYDDSCNKVGTSRSELRIKELSDDAMCRVNEYDRKEAVVVLAPGGYVASYL